MAQACGVTPDLILLGKTIAAGFAMSAVGGRKEIMDGNYFVSSTYAGEVMRFHACDWVIKSLLSDYRYKIEMLWERGEAFIKRFNEMGGGKIALEAYPSRGRFISEREDGALIKALFFQEACKAGILVGPSWFYSFANSEKDYFFFEFFKTFMCRLNLNSIKLDGLMPTSPFAERVRNGK